MYFTCGNATHHNAARDKVNLVFLHIVYLLEINNCSRSRDKIKEKYFICWLIINKPQPNLHLELHLYSGDTFLGPEGVPSLAQYRFHYNL